MLTVSPTFAASAVVTGRDSLHQVEPDPGRSGQPEHTDAEPVLAAVLGLGHDVVPLERRDQPERRRLVHAETVGDLGDAQVSPRSARSDRMVSARSTDWTAPAPLDPPPPQPRRFVAHGATLCA